MSKIAVIGGTGYTGTNVVREAASRGHDVVSWSRSIPEHPVEGVTYEVGDAAQAVSIIADADVLVLTLSPRGSPGAGRSDEKPPTAMTRVPLAAAAAANAL